ncbi:MAG: rSAM/selenodomain-associated transferase 1 [Rhodothermales bacterium]
MSRALLVFAKTPIAGTVKTRLAGALGAEGAQHLYAAFVRDLAERLGTLSQLGGAGIRIRWHVSPDPEPLRTLVGDGDLLNQTGSSLGARMCAAFDSATNEGYESVVIIGTDTPTLELATILQAFEMLKEPGQAVIGPAEDGGYYLLGLRGVSPAFLEAITYSKSDVRSLTAAMLTSAGHSVAYLPEMFDVDLPEDVARLQALLEENPSLAPSTARLLRHSKASGRQS